ncbi:S-layer homology domain-containing protein [Bacillus infantis]|uniref:S-layer homology domain-containing protein n=1 Tax=Bacillus infantis TaxID=324767 RepID=UPI001CD36E06|nr:S-layer homology domain-containing protein [Bacillus infantis]MCA1041645.1 S-layer homology domain-containing protein [Bacillus infantis]
MKKNTAWLAAVLSLMLLFPLQGKASDIEYVFKDLKNHWGSHYVEHGYALGFLNGYPDGMFKPGMNVTKAQFVKMIVAAKGYSLKMPASPSYSDVRSSDWYYPYIETALSQQLIPSPEEKAGYQPNASITREEIAAISAKALSLEPLDKDVFKDSQDMSDSGYAAALAQAGVVNGYPDGTFRPKKSLTRAEAAAIISKLVTYSSSEAFFIKKTADSVNAYSRIINQYSYGDPFSRFSRQFEDYFTKAYIKDSIEPHYKRAFGTDWLLVERVHYNELLTRFKIVSQTNEKTVIETFRASNEMTPGGKYTVTFEKSGGKWLFAGGTFKEGLDLQLSRQEAVSFVELYYSRRYLNPSASFEKEGTDRLGNYYQFRVTGHKLDEKLRIYKDDAYIDNYYMYNN